MKSMTCRQLGGACELEFSANTFDEMASMSKKHAMEMFQKGDAAHLKAMEAMKGLISDPAAMKAFFDEKKREFDSLPTT